MPHMSETDFSESIKKLAGPLLESLGLELWGLEVGISGRSLVRIYVESPTGATIDDCSEASRVIGLALDVEDIMTGPYVLEVSTPGLTRLYFKPEQLAKAVGERVEAHFTHPRPEYPGRRKFAGQLQKAAGDSFVLLPEDGPEPGAEPLPLSFAWADLKKVRLSPFFESEAPQKPGKSKDKDKPGAGGKKKKDSREDDEARSGVDHSEADESEI